MKRFDTLEEQNKAQLDLLAKHADDDNRVHRVVTRHSVYWKLLSGGAGGAMALLAAKLGLK